MIGGVGDVFRDVSHKTRIILQHFAPVIYSGFSVLTFLVKPVLKVNERGIGRGKNARTKLQGLGNLPHIEVWLTDLCKRSGPRTLRPGQVRGFAFLFTRSAKRGSDRPSRHGELE